MHVPDVDVALAELCRVCKSGGRLVIGENNMHSVDAWVYALQTRLHTGRFPGTRTATGVEHWGQSPAGPVLYRDANIRWMTERLESHGLIVERRLPRQFSELYVNVSSPWLKELIHRFNAAWFRFVRVPVLAFGNLLVAKKRG